LLFYVFTFRRFYFYLLILDDVSSAFKHGEMATFAREFSRFHVFFRGAGDVLLVAARI